MGELYGGSEAEIGGAFQKEQESAGVKRSRISRGSRFGKRHKDRGTSERILGCLTVRASWNSILMQQSRIVLSSTLSLPFCIALVLVLVSLLLLVSAALLQGAYNAYNETRGCIASKKICFLVFFPRPELLVPLSAWY